MELCYTLSDSSNDSDNNVISFEDRVKFLVNTEKKKDKSICTKQRFLIHSISDSEESDQGENAVFFKTKTTNIHDGNDLENDGLMNRYSISFGNDGKLPHLEFLKPTANLRDGVVAKQILEVNNLSSSDEVPKKIKRTGMCTQRTKKGSCVNDEKERRKQERGEKKKQKLFEKVLKESEKEICSSQKPTESIKTMHIIIDQSILSLDDSQQIFNILAASNLHHTIEENDVPNSVVWYRTVTSVTLNDNQLVKQEREDLENVLLLVISNEDFLRMIHASCQRSKGQNSEHRPLADFVVNIKSLYTDARRITSVTIGFDKYMKKLRESDNVELKSLAKKVPKNAVEQAVLELQLQTFINFHFLNDVSQLGNLLAQFTKAIAEAPFRKEKQIQKSFSWYADMDSNCPIKLAKDGATFIKLWKQQVQQFQNVGPEMAEAIISMYASPRLLLKAYSQCASSKQAENLLQNIVVRRNYGPLGTQKKIGPELSFKFYQFFTSHDGSQLLKR